MSIDPIELSRELIAFNTINPPGNELSCIQHLENFLPRPDSRHRCKSSPRIVPI